MRQHPARDVTGGGCFEFLPAVRSVGQPGWAVYTAVCGVLAVVFIVLGKTKGMKDHPPAPHSAMRYLAAASRSSMERVQALWFAPKRFESTALYERLGVLLVKQYAPTGGDFVNRHFGITIADIHGTPDSLLKFERMTRRLEAIHVIVFLGFFTFSLWRLMTRKTTFLEFGFALLIYIALILSPAMLQRYNRLRLYAVIRRLAASNRRRTVNNNHYSK